MGEGGLGEGRGRRGGLKIRGEEVRGSKCEGREQRVQSWRYTAYKTHLISSFPFLLFRPF